MTRTIPITKTLSGIPPGPVTSAAALPALAVPAVAACAEPDPIFAADRKIPACGRSLHGEVYLRG